MEMSEEIWLEEVLVPPEGLVEEMAKGLASLDERHLAAEKSLDLAALRQAKDKAAAIGRYIEERARGILRVHHPRHRPLTPEEAAHLPMAQGNLYLVRLGMELDVLPRSGRQAGPTPSPGAGPISSPRRPASSPVCWTSTPSVSTRADRPPSG
jgi:hypothetical protein